MDNNLICNIRGAPFNHLSRLRVLSLRSNRMTSIAEFAFQKLRNNVVVLNVEGNPLSCSCKMLWYLNWLEDTQSEGPRCADGTLFRDVKLSRMECGNSRIVEPVIPGCESDIVQSSVIETAQLSALTSHLKNSTQGLLPHETDYFYDEYVEYQYEELNGTEGQQEIMTTTQSPASATQKSYHLTTGDTPTLYASPSPPKFNMTNPGLGMNDVKKAQQHHQYNGLTFFGIPLPSLSFGNLWKGNSGRSVDQTQNRNPFVVGKVQPVNKKLEEKNQLKPGVVTDVPIKTDSISTVDPATGRYYSTPSNPVQGIVTPVQKQTKPKNFVTEDFVTEQSKSNLLQVATEPYIAKLHLNTEVVVPVENATAIEVATLPPWSTLSAEEPKFTVPDYDYTQWNQQQHDFHATKEKLLTQTTEDVFKVGVVKKESYLENNNWYYENYNKTNLEPYVGINEGCTTKIPLWESIALAVGAVVNTLRRR